MEPLTSTGAGPRSGGVRFAVVFLAVLSLAAVFRLADLNAKVMHGDEANQAVKAARLLEGKGYAYDPHEHHGPTLYYLTLPVFWATGTASLAASEAWQYRLVPAMFGVLGIALLWGLRDALGRAGTLWAALLLAVSHAMVYYSRYYIQETLFVFFALGVIVCGWRFTQRPVWIWAALLGASAGGMQASKETSVILYAALGAAAAAVWAWDRLEQGRWADLRPWLRPGAVATAAGAALGGYLAFYSSFGSHPRGIVDGILTYGRYFARAEGEGSTAMHQYPVWHYLQLLFFTYREPGPRWTEGFALLAGLLGALTGMRRSPQAGTADKNSHFHRFLTIYVVFSLFFFSAVPYKTPWNLLPFWQPLLMLAGLGIGWLTTSFGTPMLRAVLCLLCAAAVGHAGHQAYQGTFVYPADTRNPYVYAHTSTAILRLIERVEQIAAVHPQGGALTVAVIGEGGDYWPLPWYLRRYPNVGYWTAPPATLDADIIVCSVRLAPALSERIGTAYHGETGALRPGALLGVFVKTEWWEKFMADRQ